MSDYDLTAPHLPLNHPQNVERRLRERIAGLLDQHHRDSAELRNLCAARDEARAERDSLRARIDGAAVAWGGKDIYGLWYAGQDWKSEKQVALHLSGFGDADDQAKIKPKRIALVPLD